MALATGTRLGAYEIIAPLGAGGMGEVYRARDTKLGRSVAIKVLPDALASDPDRIARLEREAKVLASLTHANIAALYGMEETPPTSGQASRHFLVMELVEGETLADRLTRGPLKTAAALDIAGQIAQALEAAHEQGVVHRDLKPANVKITPDDTVKVLDFGLAKAFDQGSGISGQGSEERANSPTLSIMATQAGMVLGTAAYMSPEQAKGANADQRSDVFSFGVVLYEMLTCRQPFQGDTAAEVMASVLIRDPDLTALPPNLHPRLRDVITRCLEKQPKKRWQAIGDLRVELDAIAAAPHDTTGSRALPAAAPRPLWKRALAAAAIVSLTAGITAGVMWRVLRTANPSVVRFQVALTEEQRFAATNRQFVALSPDGKRIAFLIGGESGRAVLMERALDDIEARPIGQNLPVANSLFFSPDSQWIGFWSGEDSTLKKVAVTGGSAVTLGKADLPSGVRWDGDWVVFAQQGAGIMRVAAAGGQPELVARVEPPEMASNPQLINGGRTVLFAVASGSTEDRWDKANIVVQPIGSDQRQVIVRGGSAPFYVSTGHLLYAVGGTVFAVAFDPQSARVSGGPVPVVEGVMRTITSAATAAQFVVSDAGTLAYVPGIANLSGQRTLALMDRDGKAQPVSMPANSYQTPRVSPDGRRVVVATDDGREAIVWIHDLAGTGPPRRLTFGGRNRYPIWTRDGGSIIFQSDRDGDLGLFQQRADGSGQAERLTTAEKGAEHMAGSLTPDGKTLVFTVATQSGVALWTLSTTGDRTPRPLLAIPGKGLVSPALSPDGRWLAYGSNELGLSGYYVFVQPFPQTGAKYQVTTAISSSPVWAAGGKQILSSYTDQISASDVQALPQFTVGAATRIRSEGSIGSLPAIRNFDVMPDGRLLVILPASSTTTNGPRTTTLQINVVLNWFEELKAKVKG